MSLKFIKYILIMSLPLICFQFEANAINVKLNDPAASIDEELEPAEYSEEAGEFAGDAVEADGIDVDSGHGYTNSDGEAKVILIGKRRSRKSRGRKTGGIKKPSCGSCSSDCGRMLGISRLTPKLRRFIRAAKKKKATPFSCFRTRKCQNQLIRCFRRCGSPGRASKNSRHSQGRACDFRNGGKLKSIKRKHGMRTYNGIHYSH